MADYISQITLPDESTYDLKDAAAARGNGRVFYGTCSTAAGTVPKEVICNKYDTLTIGDILIVKFTNTNSAAVNDNLKLQITNSSGSTTEAKSIKQQYNSTGNNNLNAAGQLNSDGISTFVYNGTYWILLNGNFNNTYSYMRPYGSTASDIAAKIGSAGWKFQLSAGKYFMFTQYYDNTAQSALTLNIGSTGAKPIYINGEPSSANNYTLPGGQYLVYYDGTNYHFRTDDKIPGNIAGDATTVNGLTVQTAVPQNAIFTDTTSFTITANATDGLWDLTGTSGTNAVTYALAPYSAKGNTTTFYTAATNPTLTTRLNYDGYLYATKLYSGGTEVSVNGHTHDDRYSYNHLSDYDFTMTQPLSKYVTFDKSRPVGAPKEEWYNGFISSHSNYHVSYIINGHTNQNEWYVGHNIWREANNPHATAPTWYLLAHSGNVVTGDNNGQVKIAGQNVSVKGLKALAYKDSLSWTDITNVPDEDLFVKKRTWTILSELDLVKQLPGMYDHTSNMNNTLPTSYGTVLNIHGNYKYGSLIAAETDNVMYYRTYYYNTDDDWQWRGEWQTIAHATQSTNNTGSATQPIYMTNKGVIVAGTALKALAYKDSLTYSDVGAAASNHNHNGVYVPNTTGANDVNTLVNTGIYNITAGSLTNGPTGYGYGQLLVMSYRKHIGNTTTDYATQLYAHFGNGNNGNTLYYRTSNASTWQTWQMVAHANAATAMGDAKKPIYINAKGEIQEGDALKNLAYKDSLLSSDIPDNSANTTGNAATSTSANYLYPFSDGTNVPGTTNISILQTIQNSDDTPRSVPFGVKLQHGNTEVGFGYFYPKNALYGGWYIASYGNPSYITVNNGTWTSHTFLTNQNYTNYTVTKTGTGASGSWDISITGTAAKATADASGNTITSTYAPLASPALTGTPTAPTAAIGTNTTQIATTAFVYNILSDVNAMRFKGTLGTDGTVASLPATHEAGDTYRVITAGTWAGKYCEVGTLIICIKDNNTASDSDWTSIETNEDGAVIGPTESTNNTVVRWSGTSGRIIKNSSNIIIDDNGNTIIGTNSIASTLTVYGATTLNNTLQVTGNVGIGASPESGDNSHILYVNGTSNLLGDVDLTGNLNISGNIIPSSNNQYTLGSSTNRWSKVYIGTNNNYGNEYTPIYWNDGVPAEVAVVQKYTFSIANNSTTAVITPTNANKAKSIVTEIVVDSGIEYLNGPISWDIPTSGSNKDNIVLTTTNTTSGAVGGYILVSIG